MGPGLTTGPRLIRGGDASASIIALAGRRIDAPHAETARFPLARVPDVMQALSELFRRESAAALVCSAACGADLAALQVAERLGIKRRIVLPFDKDRFLQSSVTDRPGNWEEPYRRLVASAEQSGDLLVLEPRSGGEDAAYAAANQAIVREADRLATERSARRLALIVWEGQPRSGADATDGFRRLAEQAGFTVLTLAST